MLRVIAPDVRKIFVVCCCFRTGDEYERSNMLFGAFVEVVDDRVLRSKYGFGGGICKSSSSSFQHSVIIYNLQ